MLLSNEMHVQCRRNQLIEVICQFRFPAILRIHTEVPAAFQDMIRKNFPQYSVRIEQIPQAGAPQGTPPQQSANYSFVSADGHWKINLTRDFISLSTVQYQSWDLFAQQLDEPFGRFISLYEPAYFERIGLRFINAFSRRSLEQEQAQWKDWIEPHFLGILAEEDCTEQAVRKNSVDVETALPGNCYLKTHAGPGTVKRPGNADEVCFILDNDVSATGHISASQVTERLNTLHTNAYRVFRGAITDELHDLLL